MKKLLLICMAIALISCANGDAMVRILEDGIEQANRAKSPQELSDITVDVRARLIRHSYLPGGNSKMSAEETRKVIEAQERFYRAVEWKASQLK